MIPTISLRDCKWHPNRGLLIVYASSIGREAVRCAKAIRVESHHTGVIVTYHRDFQLEADNEGFDGEEQHYFADPLLPIAAKKLVILNSL